MEHRDAGASSVNSVHEPRSLVVTHLDYEAYPAMAVQVMDTIARRIEDEVDGARVVIHHRVGRLVVGEPAVVIFEHPPGGGLRRLPALSSRRSNRTLPIWKKGSTPTAARGSVGAPAAAPRRPARGRRARRNTRPSPSMNGHGHLVSLDSAHDDRRALSPGGDRRGTMHLSSSDRAHAFVPSLLDRGIRRRRLGSRSYVSAIHLRCTRRPDSDVVEDADSDGTRINGVRVRWPRPGIFVAMGAHASSSYRGGRRPARVARAPERCQR